MTTVFAVAFFNYLALILAVISDNVALAVVAAFGSTVTAVCTALGGYWAYKAKVAAVSSQQQNAANHVENQKLLKNIDTNVNGKMDKLLNKVLDNHKRQDDPEESKQSNVG